MQLSDDGQGAEKILDDEHMSEANESLSRRNIRFYLKVVIYIKNINSSLKEIYIYICKVTEVWNVDVQDRRETPDVKLK